MSKPCVFFDRDGIVNRAPVETRYVERWSDFHLLPGFVDALRVVREKGYEAIIVTNQKGVGTGRMDMKALLEIHENLVKELGQKGLGLLDILVSTDTHDSAPRRKPNPGMLLEAAEKHRIDLKKSWMVGDNKKDVDAGRRAGCKTVFIGLSEDPVGADHEVASVSHLAEFLRAHL
jgi:D-glycero-D-manno-heptose 1,7-bisphosphate phosphatase